MYMFSINHLIMEYLILPHAQLWSGEFGFGSKGYLDAINLQINIDSDDSY